MANVFFAGDLHLGHRNVHKFRTQFQAEEEHFHFVKERYHSVVGKRDKVYFMGDTAFTPERLADLATWYGERKVLICGNHDLDNLSMKDLVGVYDEIYAFCRYKQYWLSHCPIHPDELRGRLNIHGHTHDYSIDDGRYLNTSLEKIDMTPIDLHQVEKRFKYQLGVLYGK